MADTKESIYTGSDPSSLTTQQLLREVGSLKELLLTKLDGVEKAVAVAHNDLVRVPTDVQEAVGNLRELIFSEINHIKKQFEAIEQIRIEQKRDIATSVDAALKAAKEAVSEQNASNATAIAKSEAATAKQIEQQGLLITSTSKALDDKIGDIKERLTKIESSIAGFEWVRAEVANLKTGSYTLLGKGLGTKDTIGWIIAAISILWILYQAYLKNKGN